MPSAADYTFASDNTAGICPEALRAIQEANAGRVVSYGDDSLTAQAKRRFAELFQKECDVFFVFNGTAANSLALSAICRSHHSIFCHEQAHVDVDECGAPGFFTGGATLIALPGAVDKLEIPPIERALQRGHGVHSPLPAALSLTQSTELGTLYTPAETKALADFAHGHGMKVQMDGARFANAVAASEPQGFTPADLTWKSGVDVLCFGGTKNGMNSTEAVVIFDRALAVDFDRRVKQTGQLASKMRFAAAQWEAMLGSGAWLRNARSANARARQLADGLKAIPGLKLLLEPQANGVFVELSPAVYAALEAKGWHFYRFLGDHVYRLMCAWDTSAAEVDTFLADARSAFAETKKPMGHHLAQINIGKTRAPLDSPVMADFVALLPVINALAESSPGFIWRLVGDGGDATGLRPYEDPLVIVNMSVWDGIDSLRDYAYRSNHAHAFRRRREWFEESELPMVALWWIPAGTRPTVAEGQARLLALQQNGPTAEAFSFKAAFPKPSCL